LSTLYLACVNDALFRARFCSCLHSIKQHKTFPFSHFGWDTSRDTTSEMNLLIVNLFQSRIGCFTFFTLSKDIKFSAHYSQPKTASTFTIENTLYDKKKQLVFIYLLSMSIEIQDNLPKYTQYCWCDISWASSC
jgi:hypothetical protein